MAQNMSQANIDQLPAWQAAGNTGDLPVGWQAGGTSGGSSTGGTPTVANDSAVYDSLLSSLPKASDEAASLNAAPNNAFQSYLDYIKGAPSPLDQYGKISSSQGIPAMQDTAKTLQQQIYNTEDAISRIPQDVTGTTGNSIVTQSQRNGIINAKSQPLQDTLTKQSTSYGRVSDALTTAKADALNLTQLSQQGIQNIGDALKTGITVAQDNAARAMTGFTTDLQNTLNVTLQKIARGEAVSDENAKMAADALSKEKDYQNQLAIAAAKPAGTQIVDVGGDKKLINSGTGKVIADLGGGTAASPSVSQYYGSASTGATGQPTYSAPSGTIKNGWYSTGNSWIPIVS